MPHRDWLRSQAHVLPLHGCCLGQKRRTTSASFGSNEAQIPTVLHRPPTTPTTHNHSSHDGAHAYSHVAATFGGLSGVGSER
ncbi:unnamed protein product [Pleuronectes platessa]|uniref:Uncharacterized protein n=1 Tax=Pleuronectes platessa TaxID=8262 RepID=A0A9N7VDS8_PLEPL|nr:unnamed protein product [Pleuronectes platessa]